MSTTKNRIPKTVWSFLIRKIAAIFIVFGLATFLILMLIRLSPGNPFANWPQEKIEQGGWLEPLPQQFISWVGNVLVLDFGVSFKTGEDVLAQVVSKYWITLRLVVIALAMALLIAVLFTMLEHRHPHSRMVRASKTVVEWISSIPAFIIGYAFFFWFIKQFNWNLTDHSTFNFFENIVFFGILGLTLAIGNGSVVELMRHLGGEVESLRQRTFMRAVRARSGNVRRHMLRNLAIPVITILSNRFLFLLSGAVIIEKLFTVQGVGLLSVNAALARDYPVLLGIAALTVILTMLLKTITELVTEKMRPGGLF